MYESKREPGRKFMNSFVGKRFDSYSADAQPEAEAKPEKRRELDAEPHDATTTKSPSALETGVETPSATVQAHGPAQSVTYTHDHDGGSHKVQSTHSDGHTTESTHGSAAEAYGHGSALAYEAGGKEQATDVKKREHPAQQGAESEEKNYEMPDLA